MKFIPPTGLVDDTTRWCLTRPRGAATRPGDARMRSPVMAARPTAATGGGGFSLAIRFAALFHGVSRLSTAGRRRASWGGALSGAIRPCEGVTMGLGSAGTGSSPADAGPVLVPATAMSEAASFLSVGLGSKWPTGGGWRGRLKFAPAGGGGCQGFAHGDIGGERCDRAGQACGVDGWIARGAGPGGGGSAATEVGGSPEVGAGCSWWRWGPKALAWGRSLDRPSRCQL